MKKNKNLILFTSLLLVFFTLGFLTKSVIVKKQERELIVRETEKLINDYKNVSNTIDSIEQVSINYYDTANLEMLHYALNYNSKDVDKLPNYYVTNFNDTIHYNKENFFHYIALYKVAEYLLETRKHIINGLLLNTKAEEMKNIKEKSERKIEN